MGELAHILGVRERLHRRPPAWFAGVRGSGVGVRVAQGCATDERVLAVLVDRKLPEVQVPAEVRIPRELDGVPIDVVPAGGDLSAPHRSSSVLIFPSSASVASRATLTRIGRVASGRVVGLTSARGLEEGAVVTWSDGHGVCVRILDEVPGADLYAAPHPLYDARVALDLALVEVEPVGRPVPDVAIPEDPMALAARLLAHPTEALVGLGARSRSWRSSAMVRMVFPRAVHAGATGLALLQVAGTPEDAGTCWLLPHTSGTLVLAGLEAGRTGGHAWLHDAGAALVREGVRASHTWVPDASLSPPPRWAPGAAGAR